jgi:hypothetical protein
MHYRTIGSLLILLAALPLCGADTPATQPAAAWVEELLRLPAPDRDPMNTAGPRRAELVAKIRESGPAGVALLVEALLAMPASEEDPGGTMNARRWQLARDIGETGDAAVEAIEAARPRATTPLQRHELVSALAAVRTPRATAALLRLLAEKDDATRGAAVSGLVDRLHRPADTAERARVFEALAAEMGREPVEATRLQLVYATRAIARAGNADALEPSRALAVAALRDRLAKDDSALVRGTAACCLTEFGDLSGEAELRRAVLDAAAHGDRLGPGAWSLEALAPAVERVSGRSFGPVPLRPELSSDSRAVPRLRQERAAYLQKLAAWAKEAPAARPPGGE